MHALFASARSTGSSGEDGKGNGRQLASLIVFEVEPAPLLRLWG